MSRNTNSNEGLVLAVTVGAVIFVVALVIGALMFGLPIYNVWASQQGGLAELRRAEYSKQIRIQESLSKKEAAQYEADAEVTKAAGLSKAIEIVSSKLKEEGGIEYIKYLYVTGLQERQGEREIVYVPTEAGIPVLESSRFIAPPLGK